MTVKLEEAREYFGCSAEAVRKALKKLKTTRKKNVKLPGA
jgi:predicted ATP-grasp superfamily ATP-dependent carboligase